MCHKWFNAKGDYVWVQYHFKTDQGIKNLSRQEAEKLSGSDPDHATRDLYRKVMTEMDRDHLIGNIVDHLGNAAKRIQMRQTALFFKADQDYGRRVAAGLGLDIATVERLAAMSAAERAQATEPGTFS